MNLLPFVISTLILVFGYIRRISSLESRLSFKDDNKFQFGNTYIDEFGRAKSRDDIVEGSGPGNQNDLDHLNAGSGNGWWSVDDEDSFVEGSGDDSDQPSVLIDHYGDTVIDLHPAFGQTEAPKPAEPTSTTSYVWETGPQTERPYIIEEPPITRTKTTTTTTVRTTTTRRRVDDDDGGIYDYGNERRILDPFLKPGVLAVVIGGCVVGLLVSVLIVMFIVYRLRCSEGSYSLAGPRTPNTATTGTTYSYPYHYQKASTKEFYA